MDEAQNIAMFISFGIEQYSHAKGLDTIAVIDLFEKYGVSEYLCDCFDVLHTQGHLWLIDEIDDFIAKRRDD